MADQTPSKLEKPLKVGQRVEIVKDVQTKLRGTGKHNGFYYVQCCIHLMIQFMFKWHMLVPPCSAQENGLESYWMKIREKIMEL